jgi:hypothetical protein
MLLTTLSADAIVHSLRLTKFRVTGRYQVRPGILKKNISTQQSAWMEMEDGCGAVVALEGCRGVAVLGGDVGQWFKIAVAALGSGGRRRTGNYGIVISIIEAESLYYNVGISVGKDGTRGRIPCKGHMLAAMATR